MIDGSGYSSPRVYGKNEFTKEDFVIISEMLKDGNLSPKYKKGLLSLLKAYCSELYCSECRGSCRISSTDGVCEWNHNMLINLPLNNGPLRSHPYDCPIRKILNR